MDYNVEGPVGLERVCGSVVVQLVEQAFASAVSAGGLCSGAQLEALLLYRLEVLAVEVEDQADWDEVADCAGEGHQHCVGKVFALRSQIFCQDVIVEGTDDKR